MIAELKLKKLTPAEVAEATGGELYEYGKSNEISYVTYDSREVVPGSLFCAVRGERSDGHDYIKSSVESGAVCVIAERIPDGAENFGSYSIVLVDDAVASLGRLSGYYRTFSNAKTVGVTGSVGKTTTKDFIASVLGAGFRTMKTEGNHNNEIGFPMTLFGLEPDTQIAVLEMGMSARGEISFMTKLVKPDVAVITNIGTSHIENLGSRENICFAKMEIAEGMSAEGVLIINGDEPLLTEYKGDVAPAVKRIGIYNKSADYKAVNIRAGAETTFDILYDGTAQINVMIPVLGRHNVYNALMAWAVGKQFGMDDEAIRRGLLSFEGTKMRQVIYPLGDITVIEDCYNASPESMKAALEVLVTVAKDKSGRPCALLGDMLELGKDSRLLHNQLGQYAAQMKIEKLYCYGEAAETVAEAAITKGVRADNVYVCTNSKDPLRMAKLIIGSIEPGDVLLVKASRGIAAENVISELKKLINKRK